MNEHYDQAIRHLQRLEVKFDEPLTTVLAALKVRRVSLRKFLEG